MNQDTIDQLSEISSIYNNLVCRDKETPELKQTLDQLETIAMHLTNQLINDISKEINNG